MTVANAEEWVVDLDHLPAQDDFYNATERQVGFVGGLATGKTHAASDWILTGAIEYPRARHFIFSNTYPQLTTGTLTTFYERCEHWGLNYIPHVRDLHKIFLPDIPAVIEVWSVDKPINFKSLEMCRAWIDEAQAWSKDAYDKVLGRLRGTATQRRLYPEMPLQLRITANPPHTMQHWLYELTQTTIDKRTGKPPIRYITAETYDNPFVPADYIADMEASYDPEIAEAELRGKFIELGKGRAFRRFNFNKHVLSDIEAAKRGIPPLVWDPHLPVCWSHDFNLDPLCSVLFQWRRLHVDGYQRDVMYVLGEIRIENGLIQDAPRTLIEKHPRAAEIARGPAGMILYGDSSGATQGNRQTGMTDFAALKMECARLGLHGAVRVPQANPSKRDRFAAANRQFENTKGEIGIAMRADGTRYIVLDCQRMYFKPGTFDIEVPKAGPGEVIPPSRRLTHLGDAFSYPIQYDYPYVEPQHGGVHSTSR